MTTRSSKMALRRLLLVGIISTFMIRLVAEEKSIKRFLSTVYNVPHQQEKSLDVQSRFQSNDTRSNQSLFQSIETRKNQSRLESNDTRSKQSRFESIDTPSNRSRFKSINTRSNKSPFQSNDTRSNQSPFKSNDTQSKQSRLESIDTPRNQSRYKSFETRSKRFPSVKERVKIYMSNWYVPPCPGNYTRVIRNATGLTIQESTTPRKAGEKETLRTLLIKSEVQMDRIFFLDREKLMQCTKSEQPGAQNYCRDVQTSLVSALDRVGDDGTTPVFLQFGDNTYSLGHGLGPVNLPHIRKIRSVTTLASISKVTDKDCYSGPRDPLDTKDDKENLQPILWRLNNNRHYAMIPEVQKNDIPWSDKKNLTAFRGALTGVTREEAARNTDYNNCMTSRRCRLVFSHDKSTLVDARLSFTIGLINETIKGVKLTGPLLTMKQLLQNKAIIMLEGNDVATGLKWALLSNSVVMMQPPSFTSWAMEELLEAWVHYIPLNEDLSDVEEKMQWIMDNNEQAQLISQRGTLWIHDLLLHPDASNDEKRIQEEIIRRYRAHFVATKAAAKEASTQIESLPSARSASSKNLVFLAFYYPWYKRNDWSQHGTQGSTPLLGLYGSDEIEIAESHIDMAVRGGIDAWVVSWWDRKNPVTAKFANGMLKAKNIDKIKFCMIYESMGALPVAADFQKNGTLVLDKFISDMIFFRDTYFGHPSYLHVNGRPVVYVYITRYWKNFEPSMLEKIKKAVGKDILIIADDPFFGHNNAPEIAQNGIKNGKPVFEAYTTYNMYEAERVQKGESAANYMFREALPIFEKWSRETVFFPNVLPKYHDFREGHKPLAGDAAGLLAQLKTFACLPRPSWYKNEFPDLMFVTSFNEWWEGSSIEPDAEDKYGYKLLDMIKAFKDSRVQCKQKQGVD